MIEKRLNSRCSNREVFNKHKSSYEQALKKSGYNKQLTFNTDAPDGQAQRNKRHRYPRIFWFNPPYHLGVRTKIGREFLRIVDKCFPKGTRWNKFFNRHTVKVSYSCTRNVASIISAHNQKIMRTQTGMDEPGCNCSAGPCPVEGKCLTEGVVYSGTIETRRSNYTYWGSTANTFKQRFYGHKQDLTNETRQGTTLSSMFWKLKNDNPDETPEVKWKIVNRCHQLKAGMPHCDVCLTEKTRLLLQHEGPEPKPPPDTIFLNKRNEIFAKCRHRRKYTLRFCKNLYLNETRGQN